MPLLASLAVAAQLAAAVAAPRPAPPRLALPDPALDDTAAYAGYRTRLHQDAAGNTLQLLLNEREQRVVHLWADSENESLAFTVRAPDGATVPLGWGTGATTTTSRGRWRALQYPLRLGAPAAELSVFLLGSMRVERDLQYAQRHRPATDAPPFRLAEYDTLRATLAALPPVRRREHLARLRASSLDALAARFAPSIGVRRVGTRWVVDVRRPSLDGRDSLRLTLELDADRVDVTAVGDRVRLAARDGRGPIALRVAVATTAAPLTPLSREALFTPEFLAWLAAERARAAGRPAGDTLVQRVRRLERQVTGVELLASREKLMAGLPTYATYFGRDMLVSALMLGPIWRPTMAEFVLDAALRKLSPDGQVSHEEALGEQAVRETVPEYATTVRRALAATAAGDAGTAGRLLDEAGDLLARARHARETYIMVDDEFQLPVVLARWLADPRVLPARQRAFLAGRAVPDGPTRLALILRELGLVARRAAPYAADPVALKLVAFPPRADGFASLSWRDSGAGYAGGRFAMDVNAIWVPAALDALAVIAERLAALGWPAAELAAVDPAAADSTPLGRWLADPAALAAARRTWHAAERHFVVTLPADEGRRRVAARLADLPAEARTLWERRLAADSLADTPLTFLALALDGAGQPIPVLNTDPATRLFLENGTGDPLRVARDVAPVAEPYPRGLLVEGVGPLVANDAYAASPVWRTFAADPYHGPTVVWGREVNLFLLGAGARALRTPDPAEAARLRAAMRRVLTAVEASGFHSELWSHAVRDGRPVPQRYGSGADVQLWSTTDLAVQYLLSRLP